MIPVCKLCLRVITVQIKNFILPRNYSLNSMSHAAVHGSSNFTYCGPFMVRATVPCSEYLVACSRWQNEALVTLYMAAVIATDDATLTSWIKKIYWQASRWLLIRCKTEGLRPIKSTDDPQQPDDWLSWSSYLCVTQSVTEHKQTTTRRYLVGLNLVWAAHYSPFVINRYNRGLESY